MEILGRGNARMVKNISRDNSLNSKL